MPMTADEVQAAIANANPALVFAIERDHLASQAKNIQHRLFGLHGVVRCFRDSVTNDNPDVHDGLITVLSELENLAETTQTIADRMEKLGQ